MCKCPSIWDTGPEEPIYEYYSSSSELLDKIATYYPKQFNEMNLDQAVMIGRGAEAYVFCVNGVVTKFTQSIMHAKVSYELSKVSTVNKYPYLVKTYSCEALPALGLWCITEERLLNLSPSYKRALSSYLDEGELVDDSNIPFDVDRIVADLARLGVMEWKADCVAAHNIMATHRNNRLVAFDFGYTHSHFTEDIPIWS